MKRWQSFVALMAHREAPTALAWVRIAVGLVVLQSFFEMWRTDSYFLVLSDRVTGEGFRSFAGTHWLLDLVGGTSTEGLTRLGLLVGVGAIATVLGLGGPLGPLLTLQACLALFVIHPASGGGHDRVITNALWLLVLSPASRTLSLDSLITTGKLQDLRPRPAWARYLIIVQLAVIYGTTGMQKLGSDWFPWGDYRAIYLALLVPAWSRWDLGALLGQAYPLTQLGTAVTWWWEVTWPVVLLAFWFRKSREQPGKLRAIFNRLDLRWAYAVIGVGMHTTVWVLMELGPFSAIMLALYPALWHPDELRRRGG